MSTQPLPSPCCPCDLIQHGDSPGGRAFCPRLTHLEGPSTLLEI